MPKQVPEEKKCLSEDEQLAKLRTELMGNKVFGRQRGQWWPPLFEVLDEIVTEAESPTQAVKRFDEFFAGTRVMVQKLAKLKRDGDDAAFDVLKSSMERPAYIIPGETFPLEETRLVTLVMFDPERTLFIRELTRTKKWRKPCEVAGLLAERKITGEKIPRDRDRFLAEKFTPMFPHWREDAIWCEHESCSLANVFWQQMQRELGLEKRIMEHPPSYFYAVPKPIVKQGKKFNGRWLRYNFDDTSRGTPGYMPLCLWYYGRPDEFLRLFTREEQKLLHTWSFDFPKMADEPDTCSFGFHVEDRHAMWQKKHPSFASKNISAGMGAMIIDSDWFPDYADDYRAGHAKLILHEAME